MTDGRPMPGTAATPREIGTSMPDQILVRAVWTPEDARQALADIRRHQPERAEPCNCEFRCCKHSRLAVAAGKKRALWVGAICDDCAATHMAPYLTEVVQ